MGAFTDVSIILFHNHYPVMTCKPMHVGLMGVFIKGEKLDYPVGTILHVGFDGFEDFYHIDGQRFSMVVINSDEKGIGLNLVSYKIDNLYRWSSTLSTISKVKKLNKVVKTDKNNVEATMPFYTSGSQKQ